MEERILDNKYIINKIIGTGGMSIVYSGFLMDTGQEVAIKVLRPEYLEDDEFIRRFRKESKIAQQLRHRNIIKTISTGEDEGLPYIVMEYIRGKTLKDYIEQNTFLSNEEAIDIGVKISDAMFYAHSHKLIHRDIKPQNVMLSPDGSVKVTDFGIARIQDSGTVTLGGSNVLGSVHYISPEQARGANATEKADIYSLGIVLYEMVTGTVPFEGDTPVSVAIMHLQDAPVPPRLKNPQVSEALEQIIMKAISKEPEVRYDNAFEMMQDLERAIDTPEGGFVKVKLPKGDTQVNIPVITHEMELMAQKERETRGENFQSSKNGAGNKSYTRTKRRRSSIYSILRLMLTLIIVVGMVITLFFVGRSLLNNDEEKPMKEVPRIMGQSEDTALSIITSAGFLVQPSYEHHALVAESVVIRQDPQPGIMLREGSTVYVTISLGVETVIVPNVLNRDYAEAAILIENAGLVVGDIERIASDSPVDYVLEQNPAADEEIPIGESINLKIAKEEEIISFTMKNVLGLSTIQAQTKIENMGYQVYSIIEINSNETKGTIVKQNPEEGEILKEDTQITLWASNGMGADYKKEHVVLLSIAEDNTHVVIKFVDNGIETIKHDAFMDKGDYEITLTLISITWGEKELYVFLNDEQYSKDRINFAVEDG